MTTHPAVVTAEQRAPLQIKAYPTVKPGPGKVRVHQEWTASTPLDLHISDGDALGKGTQGRPVILGDGIAGTVVEVGPDNSRLKIGDKVFGFAWRTPEERADQQFATTDEYLLGKLPPKLSLAEAVTVPNNLVTVFHTVTADVGLPLAFPRPSTPPEHAETPILIWAGSSSVGQYALQVLRHWGYRNLLTTASRTHHAMLKEMGAVHVFDYRDANVADDILKTVASTSNSANGPAVPFIIDCIGSAQGSLAPLTKVAQAGSRVAVLLPVIVRDASESTVPELAWVPSKCASWAPGVEVRGVRTHFYLENKALPRNLQSEVMPQLLEEGVVQPNRQKIVEGATMLERAQKALDMLRRKEVSGERLVWRVADE